MDDDYSANEIILNPNSQTSGTSKRIKKVRKQKSDSQRSSNNSTDNSMNKRNKKSKKNSHQITSTDKADTITLDSFDNRNSFNSSLDQSNQINSSELSTEPYAQDFSSDLSQRAPTNLTKENWTDKQKKTIQSVKHIKEINIILDESSTYSDNIPKLKKKTKSKTKSKKRKQDSSQNSLNPNTINSSNETQATQKKPEFNFPDLTGPPKRRDLFDKDDIENQNKPKKLPIIPSTDRIYSDDSTLSEQEIFVKPQPDLTNVDYSSLNTTESCFNESEEIDISQTPLPNDSDFKKLQSNAVLSIKSINVNDKSTSIPAIDHLSDTITSTSNNELIDSDLSQYQKSYFKESRLTAIREIKEINADETLDISSTSESVPVDLNINQKVKEDKSNSFGMTQSSQTKTLSGTRLKSTSDINISQGTKTKDESTYYFDEEEEEENDSLTHSQMNPTVDNLSEKFDGQNNVNHQSEELNISGHFFNNELTDDRTLRELKSKVDDLIVNEPPNLYMKKGIRIRPKEDDKEVVYGRLELPEKNNELQFDSEVSELDVEFITDKKKFKKSIVSPSRTNKIQSNIVPIKNKNFEAKDNSRYNNDYNRSYTTNSQFANNRNRPSNFENSGISSFLSSDISEIPLSREIQIEELIPEDSSMYQTKFDVQQANSDDEGSLFEQFKRNANFLSSSSSDDQNQSPLPKTRSTPNNSVTEVVDNTYTEIDSISGSSGSSKRHKDKTVTKGRITLYKLSSSSSFDENDDENEDENISGIQEREIKAELPNEIDNFKDDLIRHKNEKISKQSSYERSNNTQNCYFDGNVILKLTIVQARKLPQESSIPLDPYCTVAVGDKKKSQRTKTIRSSANPIWDQQFIFNYNIHKLHNRPSTPSFPNNIKQNGIFLFIQVISEDKFSGDREISTAQLDIKDIQLSKYIDEWVKLTPSEGFRTGGEIRLNLLIQPETPISSISPRKVKIQNDDNVSYILSPRAQTPSGIINPFAEPTSQKQKSAKTNSNNNIQKSPNEDQTIAQPKNTLAQRPWTDSSSSQTSIIVEPKLKNDKDSIIVSLADEEEEEEDIGYDYAYEEDQNGFHTEIHTEHRAVNKNVAENVDNKYIIDQELLDDQDDSGELSPIEPTDLPNDEGNSSLICLPAENSRKINIQNEDDDLDNFDNEKDFNEDDFDEGDTDKKLTSISSGEFQFNEFDSDN